MGDQGMGPSFVQGWGSGDGPSLRQGHKAQGGSMDEPLHGAGTQGWGGGGSDEPQLDSRVWGWEGQEMNPSFMQGHGDWWGGRGGSEGRMRGSEDEPPPNALLLSPQVGPDAGPCEHGTPEPPEQDVSCDPPQDPSESLTPL